MSSLPYRAAVSWMACVSACVVGHVQSYGFGCATVGHNQCGGCSGAGGVAVGHNKAGTFCGHGQCARATNPGPGGGHKRDTALQKHQRPSQDLVAPRRKMLWAVIRRQRETASTMLPMALISGVTPRRIDENT